MLLSSRPFHMIPFRVFRAFYCSLPSFRSSNVTPTPSAVKLYFMSVYETAFLDNYLRDDIFFILHENNSRLT